MEQAYRITHGPYNLMVMTPNNLMDDKESNQVRLFKLHGSITDVYSEQKPLLVTYDDLIKKESFKQNVLKILTNSLHETIIFVGYSFPDRVMEEILNTFKTSKNYDSIKQKYAISPNPSKSDVPKFDTIYSTTIINSKADDFFIELNNKFESNIKAKLVSGIVGVLLFFVIIIKIVIKRRFHSEQSTCEYLSKLKKTICCYS